MFDAGAMPVLATLDRPASWVNRAGRVDRSACLEIRASELWRHCTNMTLARTGKGRIAVGSITVHARWLARIHSDRLPFALKGDFRTAKSNAMKDHLGPCTLPLARQNWPRNPNRSAARTKRLGLWDGCEPMNEARGPWRQTIRIERWERRPRDRRSERQSASPAAPPRHQHFLLCPGCGRKVMKLFMVLCTSQEVADAELAESWINRCEARARSINATLPREVQALRAKLIDRYGLLFRRRRLVCRGCLGIRYGEAKGKNANASPRIDRRPQRPANRD